MWGFIKQIYHTFSKDDLFEHAAALAYTTVFSLAPSLLIIVGLCGIFFGEAAAQGRVFEQISHYIGTHEAQTVQNIIRDASIAQGDVLSTILGGVILFFAATTSFAQMKKSLNTIWDVKRSTKRKSITQFALNRLFSLVLIVTTALLILASALLSAFLAGFGSLISSYLFIPEVILSILNGLLTGFMMTLFFTLMYKVLPDIYIPWREALVGAFTTTLLFLVGKIGISFYIEHFQASRTYGIAGSAVIILLGIYFTSIIVFLGAVITKVYGDLRRKKAFLTAGQNKIVVS